MKHRIPLLLCLLGIILGLLLPAFTVSAAPLDTEAEASLTLHYQKDGNAFPDLQIGIYRVAKAFPDGSFQLIEPFSAYPVDIHGITKQEQWQQVATTLGAYIDAGQLKPYRQAPTDANGTVCFSQLETGLYFVGEVVADNATGTYIFNQFLVYLPTAQPDGSYIYNVEARPKCTSFVPKTQYTVTKLWRDGGKADRPKAVTVNIYADGVLLDTQVLNMENNWTYTWQVSGENYSKWAVTEAAVPEGYKVSIRQNGTAFSIINTYQTTPNTPQTGDSFTPLPWVLALCVSGVLLLILGIYGRRRK